VRTDLFDFFLPEGLIASRPPADRDGGRMLVVEHSGVRHDLVRHLPEALAPGDLVVLNETRVRRARLFCTRPRDAHGGGGAKVELLFLHPVGDKFWVVLGKANRPLRAGDKLLGAGLEIQLTKKGENGTWVITIEGDVETALEQEGEMPIPPYIARPADEQDVDRYQTVFARELGSAAAPTAGLHLTDAGLARLEERGVEVGRLVLHVGIGTFRPVTADDLDAHPMHEEWISANSRLADQVEKTRKLGGRVVAIGTTVVRALESLADSERPGRIRAGSMHTRILIQPGFQFRIVDALLTNFHMPKSTLVALVAAFAGRERVLAAYAEAVQAEYRFLSYGDAMWIPKRYP